MSLTRKQKSVLLNVLLYSWAVIFLSAIGFMIVRTLDQPAQAQPQVPVVNAQHHEEIKAGDNGTIDHYCLGTTGIWTGPNTSDFAVEAGDPLCR